MVGGANSSNVTIRNNVVHNCRTGIDVYAEDTIVVEGNSAVANSSSGISVQSCETTNEFGTCRGVPSGPVVPIVSNNRSGGNGAHGIFLRDGENAVVQNNVTYSNALTGISLRGVPDGLVVNNLVYRNGQEGLSVGSGFLAPGDPTDPATLASPNAIVLNNTFFENGDWAVEIGNSLAASPGAAVVHNIAWRNGAGRLGIGVLNERGQTPVRQPSVCNYVAGFNDVLDDYGPDTPRNAYDLRVDPLFVDPEGADGVAGGEVVDGQFIDRSADDDFRLRQSGGQISPAVDAGATSADRLGLSGSTASSGAADTGRIDLGFHYGASAAQVVALRDPVHAPLRAQRWRGYQRRDDAWHRLRHHRDRGPAGARRHHRGGRARASIASATSHSPPDSGRAFFVADAAGERTGDAPGVTLVDPGKCYFDPIRQEFSPGQTGFNLSSVCGAVIDGFHVTGASDDGIQLQNQSDGAEIRDNVTFANSKRGINVVNSDDVHVTNNLSYGNSTGGIQIGSGSRSADACADGGARRAVIEFNTVYKNVFNGIQIGTGACPSTGATVRYNVTGENGLAKRGAGIEVGNDQTREQDLVGYESSYNLVADRYAHGHPARRRRSADRSRRRAALRRSDRHRDDRRLAHRTATSAWCRRETGDPRSSRGVDFSDLTALKAGMSTRRRAPTARRTAASPTSAITIRRGGALIGDCNGDGRVMVNEIVLAVNIAVGNAAVVRVSGGEQRRHAGDHRRSDPGGELGTPGRRVRMERLRVSLHRQSHGRRRQPDAPRAGAAAARPCAASSRCSAV